MPKLYIRALRAQAYKLVLLPATVVLLISVLLLLIKGWQSGYSTALGGMLWILPNLMQANRLFANVSVRAAKTIVRNLYVTELVKLIVTVILFLALIKWVPVTFGYLFLGYAIALVSFWLAPLLILKR